jgi:two-component system phosphate regulon sensor histidine kinase PhoR
MKNRLKYIIALMSFAVLGLLWLQVSWVRNALQINREQFERDAIQALRNISEKLEQKELADLAWRDLAAENPQENEISISDSSTHISQNEECRKEKREHRHHHRKHKTIRTKRELSVRVTTLDTHFVFHDTTGKLPIPPLPPQLSDERVTKRTKVLNKVFRKMMFATPDISQRIEPALLDSLVKTEIAARGIETSFDYAVTDPLSDGLLVTRPNTDEASLRSTPLRAALFPNDLSGVPSFLLIRFPEQNEIIWKKTSLTLLASALLLVVVIVCFGVSVHTIWSQKKLSEMKDDFINNMTHEFKTPVATISLACEALQDPDMAANANIVQRYVGIIGDENKRMSLQIENVLTAARLERGNWNFEKQLLEANGVLAEVVANMSMQVEAAGGSISSEMMPSEVFILADKLHFVNILQNLLDNANKYSVGAPKIEVKTFQEADAWILQVTDHGIGMSAEQQKRIFEKFYRVPTGNIHNVKGFGLGLNYAQSVAVAHGASISVQSKLQKGSTFTLRWPLAHQS